jgi:hypothetical protein
MRLVDAHNLAQLAGHIRVSGDKSPPLLRINYFWKFAAMSGLI